MSIEEMKTNSRVKKLVKEKEKEERQNRQHMSLSGQRKLSNTIIYIILTVLVIVWLIPFFFLLMDSLKCDIAADGVTRVTWQSDNLFPKKWGFDNYVDLFTRTSFIRWFTNTTIVGLATAVLQTGMVLLMSYTLSRLRFKGRKFLMNFMLILGMFPGFLSMILLYKLLSDWGMTQQNSIFGLILVYCASSGMGYYISKGFFDTIPRSLDEAARIDGATRAQIFGKIILPLSKPILIYTILTAFMAPWGDFMFASYIAHSTDIGKNVAVGLRDLIATSSGMADHYTWFCAGGVIVAIPITLLFMFLQKYYVEGVTGGAVKG
jgi:arabinogalactan oligomer/maltooligosaccharide transport system permease protein